MKLQNLLHPHKATWMQALVLVVGLTTSRADVYKNEALTATKAQVTAGPSRLTGYTVVNQDASNPAYVHIYNALAADVTVGTTATDYLIAIPAGGAVVLVLNDTTQFTAPKGMTIAATTSPLSTGSSAPSSATVIFLSYGPNP